jgi:outer membrane protein assembly factor BamB
MPDGTPQSDASDRISRRTFLRTGVLAGIAGVAGCLQVAPHAPAEQVDEPTAASEAMPDRPATIFRSDIARTGYWPEQRVPADVELAWSVPGINTGDHTAAKASPLYYDGSVITGGDDGTVYSFTPGGDLEWSTNAILSSRGTHATPAIVDDLIFITGYDGAVYAIEADTGNIRWRTKVSDSIGSSPVYYEGVVYIATEFITPSGGMVALDAASGAMIWEDNRVTDHSHSQAGIDTEAGILAAGSNDGSLYVWDLETQAFVDTFDTGDAIKGPICMYDGMAIFGSWDGNVYAVDTSSLDEVWQYDIGAKIMAGAAVHPETGTVVIGSHDHRVYALDVATGDSRWDFDTGGMVVGSPNVVGDTVLAGSYSDTLYALEVETGEQRWRFEEPEGFVTGTPAVHDGNVYVTERATDDQTGHLYKIRPA